MEKLNPSEYYRAERSPYYIVAPDYQAGSSGIRVLHYLCHVLNLHGYEAYVQANKINESLWAPQLDEKIMRRHYMARRKPIVIYPEVVLGSPLGLGIKVRYLLNKPGYIAGQKEFDDDEIIIAYREPFIADSGSTDTLLLPACDPTQFNTDGTDPAKREGRYFFYNRFLSRGGKLLPITDEAIEISPAKRRPLEDLATIFKQAELLYCYEDSAVTVEARMCGCPVVYIPNPTMLKEYPADSFGRDGCAWGASEEEISHAKATVHKVFPRYLKLYDDLQTQLINFIEITQAAAKNTTFAACYPVTTIQKNKWPILDANSQFKEQKNHDTDREYNLWRERKSLQEIDGQILAEHINSKWTFHPYINIVIDLRKNETNLLADTIDSLATQWYPNWHLTVVADFPPDNPELAEIEQITWAVCEPGNSQKTHIDRVIKQTPGNWLLILEPGDTLEPHALAYFADTINLNPQNRLIYSDSDTREPSGKLGSPHFKPDFNLELLRNMYYMGSGILLQKQAFEAAGGWSFNSGNALYDLTLRINDYFGTKSIAHLPEVLIHNPSEQLREIDDKAEIEATLAHIQRNRISAEVLPGFLNGTQMVRYQLTHQPLVSIVIPTRDQPGYLSHCIESLISETKYQNWEIIIVDHDSTDPDAIDYMEQLIKRQGLAQPIQYVRFEGGFNYAHLCNLGAQQAKGEYLLFLDNDTEIIQPAWLENMLAYFEQPDVAAVAPRLSKPDGKFSILNSSPRFLGGSGLAFGMAGQETNLLEPGYCARLQVAQDVSALFGSCLMVSTKVFFEQGKFNETDTPIFQPVLDLCLRLREAQLRLIWTPWVDVVHHDGITRKRIESDTLLRARLTENALSERSHLCAKHMKALANDPHYNRNLSLISPFSIDSNAVIDWDTRFHDRLRVLGIPLTSGSGEYRIKAPFRALQKGGLAQANTIHPFNQRTQRILSPIELARAAPDVLMLQQAIDDNQIAQLKEYRRFNSNVFITYAVDDLLGNLPRKHYLYNFHAREGKSRMREGLAHCDRLIVSTEPIAEYCRNMVADIVVAPNCLEGERWLNLNSERGTGHKPRVGWAGAQQHLGDLEMMQTVVETLRDEVDWIFMGMCPDFLKPHVCEEHGFVSFNDYPAKLASLNLDLAIAPLEQHLFNEGKSNLRLLEYGIMGWPVVCTDIYPYQTNQAPVKRVTNDAQAWIAAIRERIYDLDATYKEGNQLREWVLKHYILEDHLDEWLRAMTPTAK